MLSSNSENICRKLLLLLLLRTVSTTADTVRHQSSIFRAQFVDYATSRPTSSLTTLRLKTDELIR